MSRRSSSADLPLFAWGDELRRRTKNRIRARREITAGGVGIALLLMPLALPPAPRLVWNASASAPIGLYAVAPNVPIKRGDMVIARVPKRMRSLAAVRRYIPIDVPLVKRVVAEPGDRVCAIGRKILVDGRVVAERRSVDAQRRRIRWWTGCRTLRNGNVLLLMRGSAKSFDGRYFGPTPRDELVGRARLLWQR